MLLKIIENKRLSIETSFERPSKTYGEEAEIISLYWPFCYLFDDFYASITDKWCVRIESFNAAMSHTGSLKYDLIW